LRPININKFYEILYVSIPVPGWWLALRSEPQVKQPVLPKNTLKTLVFVRFDVFAVLFRTPGTNKLINLEPE
jgi:hypothetical protein